MLDDINLKLALEGKPFANCSCEDLDGDSLDSMPVSSACVSVDEDDIDMDVEAENALECESMVEVGACGLGVWVGGQP